MHRFLQSIKVLDLSQYIPGPFATRQLADWGANVIKIEPPAGDPMRYFGGGETTVTSGTTATRPISPVYAHLNRGKRILHLDLKAAGDKTVFKTLLADADVLLESFRPGVLARLGFDRITLAQLNPNLIHCALSGYGQTGPYQQRAGHDLNYCAAAGMLSSTEPGKTPTMTFPPIADHAGAMQAANAILAALLSRALSSQSHVPADDSPQGTFLDISLCEATLSWQYLQLNGAADIEQLLSGGYAGYNIYETADQRFITLGALEHKFWRAFCEAVGHPEWTVRQQDTLPQRNLMSSVQSLFFAQKLAYWQQLLGEVDCCFEAVPLLAEVTEHPQFQARQSMQQDASVYSGSSSGQSANCTVTTIDAETARWQSDDEPLARR